MELMTTDLMGKQIEIEMGAVEDARTSYQNILAEKTRKGGMWG